MLITDQYVFFYSNKDCFSNFYPCKFYLNGIEFSCSEQFMMHEKAVLFGDHKIGKQILVETRPARIKALGRQVGNFNEQIWLENRERIMYDAVVGKFSQNDDLRKIILDTGNKLLVEASPNDKIWGIGLAIDDSRIHDPKNWKGSNLLGKALMKAREYLKNDKQNLSKT